MKAQVSSTRSHHLHNFNKPALSCQIFAVIVLSGTLLEPPHPLKCTYWKRRTKFGSY